MNEYLGPLRIYCILCRKEFHILVKVFMVTILTSCIFSLCLNCRHEVNWWT